MYETTYTTDSANCRGVNVPDYYTCVQQVHKYKPATELHFEASKEQKIQKKKQGNRNPQKGWDKCG